MNIVARCTIRCVRKQVSVLRSERVNSLIVITCSAVAPAPFSLVLTRRQFWLYGTRDR